MSYLIIDFSVLILVTSITTASLHKLHIKFFSTVNKKGWNLERNQETGTESYAYKGNQWVGFDDKRSVRKKVSKNMHTYIKIVLSFILTEIHKCS